MAESTLSLNYAGLQAEVGYFLCYGRSSVNWNADQIALIPEIVKTGLRRFYGSHDWSFLKIQTTLATVSGTAEYTLPADFGGIMEGFTYATGVNYREITNVSEYDIRIWSQMTVASNRPYHFAVYPGVGPTGSTAGQRMMVKFFPTPNGAYTLTYRYRALPDKLDDTNTYPYGGSEASEALLEHCLAVAEQRVNSMPDFHTAEAQRLTEILWAKDKKYNTPSFLGYNGDSSTRRETITIIRPAQYNGQP